MNSLACGRPHYRGRLAGPNFIPEIVIVIITTVVGGRYAQVGLDAENAESSARAEGDNRPRLSRQERDSVSCQGLFAQELVQCPDHGAPTRWALAKDNAWVLNHSQALVNEEVGSSRE